MQIDKSLMLITGQKSCVMMINMYIFICGRLSATVGLNPTATAGLTGLLLLAVTVNGVGKLLQSDSDISSAHPASSTFCKNMQIVQFPLVQ